MTAIATLEGSARAVTYETTTEDIAKLAASYAGLSATEDYEAVRVAIADLRTRRVAVEARRKDLKRESLEFGRKVDEVAKALTASIEAIEAPLQASRQAVDDEKDRLKREAEDRKRAELEARVRVEREAEDARLRAERAAEEARLAEVARLQAIEADRILMENAKLEVARKAEEKRAKAGPDECWPWTGGLDEDGYGRLYINGGAVQANRFALELKLGRSLMADEVSRHTCDNPPCCNDDHLIPGSKADNSADAVDRERQARGERSGTAKLVTADVLEIRRLAGSVSFAVLALRFGVCDRTVRYIAEGKRWRHVPAAPAPTSEGVSP